MEEAGHISHQRWRHAHQLARHVGKLSTLPSSGRMETVVVARTQVDNHLQPWKMLSQFSEERSWLSKMPTSAENFVSFYIKCVFVYWYKMCGPGKRGRNMRNWFVLKFFWKLFRNFSINFVPGTWYWAMSCLVERGIVPLCQVERLWAVISAQEQRQAVLHSLHLHNIFIKG